MDEVKTNKVENLPVLEEVPEGATLIAEVDGEFYRVKGEGVGGGLPEGGGSGRAEPDAIIRLDADWNELQDYGILFNDPHFEKGSYAELIALIDSGVYPYVVLKRERLTGNGTKEVFFEPCKYLHRWYKPDDGPDYSLHMSFELTGGGWVDIDFDFDGNFMETLNS